MAKDVVAYFALRSRRVPHAFHSGDARLTTPARGSAQPSSTFCGQPRRSAGANGNVPAQHDELTLEMVTPGARALRLVRQDHG